MCAPSGFQALKQRLDLFDSRHDAFDLFLAHVHLDECVERRVHRPSCVQLMPSCAFRRIGFQRKLAKCVRQLQLEAYEIGPGIVLLLAIDVILF